MQLDLADVLGVSERRCDGRGRIGGVRPVSAADVFGR
jgi:hypothetical protein